VVDAQLIVTMQAERRPVTCADGHIEDAGRMQLAATRQLQPDAAVDSPKSGFA
jgi:hypothetical protein